MGQTSKYGWLEVNYDIPNWPNLVEGMVLKEDVYENGMEMNPHTTILYGFHENILSEHLIPYLMPSHYIKVEFKNINIFEGKEYDVLKFECDSEALRSLHKTVKYYFDNSWQWPDYNPHATISYMKSGTGKKYVNELETPFTLVPSGYRYVSAEGVETIFDVDVVAGADTNIVVK